MTILYVDERVMMITPIKIGIVDDHAGVRIAVRGLLANAQDMEVVGEGASGTEAILLLDGKKPDILLLDVEMPRVSGYEVMRQIMEKGADVKVLALSTYDDPTYILSMIENGADGYITKDEAPDLLLPAIRSIMQDKVKWISPKAAKMVSQVQLDDKTFTGRELEILRYIVLGITSDEITRNLDISERLLKRYIQLLMEKFNVSTFQSLKECAQGVISTTHS